MIILSPLRVLVTKSKYFTLNLNQYRNTYFHTLNKAKVVYKELVSSQVLALPTLERVELTYTLYPKDNRLSDIDNICSIHSKFFQDALVELGKLPDDNYRYIPKTIFTFGEIDKSNPRVEIQIQEIQ